MKRPGSYRNLSIAAQEIGEGIIIAILSALLVAAIASLVAAFLTVTVGAWALGMRQIITAISAWVAG